MGNTPPKIDDVPPSIVGQFAHVDPIVTPSTGASWNWT
jgi:hypothetical protein